MNGPRSTNGASTLARFSSGSCSRCSACARLPRWCCRDRARGQTSRQRPLDRRDGTPGLGAGAGDFSAAAFSGARLGARERSAIGKLSALERSAAGQSRRNRTRVFVHRASARRLAHSGDREFRLARRPEAAGHLGGGIVCHRRLRFSGARVLKAMKVEHLKTDILILGAGGAGLFAALHALKASPDLDVTIASKGLLGKCGCTRMVQGGYNVAINPGDSIERHFMDTIEGGKWLPHQELAWTLVSIAVERVRELENEIGCFFDRNPDGTLHGKAFAGQSFDRTVHKGDLTGIEIINRLMEQVWARPVHRLEEHRAVALIPAKDGAIAGALMIDLRTGEFRFIQAQAVLLATGGGPTMYRYHTPSGDKSMDGLAMALRLGLPLRDMEMVQFHPTGLLAGPDTRMTGTVLEEGLRGAGGHLLNAAMHRFMGEYDPKLERATRDVVSRAMYAEMKAGRTTPNGGLFIKMGHLGPAKVAKEFKGMVDRCRDCGFDLASGLVEVVPTAHYFMGGVICDVDTATECAGLFVAGEDASGMHGANRLGGNGVANSTVFGGIAGDVMPGWIAVNRGHRPPDEHVLDFEVTRAEFPFSRQPGDVNALRENLLDIMWDYVGVVRDRAGIERGLAGIDAIEAILRTTGVANRDRGFNLTWHDWLNLQSLCEISRVIALAALRRENSRGAHYRSDFPEPGDLATSTFTVARQKAGRIEMADEPVLFTHVKPGETLLRDQIAAE